MHMELPFNTQSQQGTQRYVTSQLAACCPRPPHAASTLTFHPYPSHSISVRQVRAALFSMRKATGVPLYALAPPPSKASPRFTPPSHKETFRIAPFIVPEHQRDGSVNSCRHSTYSGTRGPKTCTHHVNMSRFPVSTKPCLVTQIIW